MKLVVCHDSRVHAGLCLSRSMQLKAFVAEATAVLGDSQFMNSICLALDKLYVILILPILMPLVACPLKAFVTFDFYHGKA